MSTRDAIIRIKVQPGQFNSAIRQMQTKVSSAGKRMGTSLREPLRKGIEAGTDAAKGLANELGNALSMAATLGGAISGGALVREAAMAEKTYLQLANAISTMSGESFNAADAQRTIEEVAKRTNLPIKDLQTGMSQLASTAGKADIGKMLERAGSQARRLGVETEFVSRVYTRLVAKGIAKTGEEAENVTEQLNTMMRTMLGIDIDEAMDPNDVAEMAAFINTTGNSAAQMFQIIKMGGKDVSKDFGKMNEVIEEIGLTLGQTKGIKDMKKALGVNRSVIDDSKSSLENFISIAEAGPKAFEKMADAFGTDTSRAAAKEIMGGEDFIRKAKKGGKAGRKEWDIKVAFLREQILTAADVQVDRAKIEKEDAKHKETMVAKFDAAMNKLQMAMMKPGVIKAMNSLADSLPKLAEELAKLIEFIANNPLTAIGAGVGLKVGGAALGGFGRSMIEQRFGGGAGGVGGANGGVGGAMNAGAVTMNKIGSVAFAAAAGIAIGTAISETIIQPMAKDASKAGRSAENIINQAENAVNATDIKGKFKALDDLDRARKKNKESLYSLDTVVGEVVGIFSDAKTPIEKYKENLVAISQAHDRLVGQLEREAEKRKKEEAEAQAKALKELGIAAAGATKMLDNMGGKNNSRGTGKLKSKPGSEPVKQSE